MKKARIHCELVRFSADLTDSNVGDLSENIQGRHAELVSASYFYRASISKTLNQVQGDVEQQQTA
jgi:hypothetical protein